MADKETKKLSKETQRLEKTIQSDPSPTAILHLSENYKALKTPEKAAEVLSRGIGLFPDNTAIRIAYARALTQVDAGEENLKEARSLLQDIMMKTPDNLAAQKALNALNQKLSEIHESSLIDLNLDSAEDTVPAENDEAGDELDAHVLAFHYLKTGQPQEALEIFQSILEKNPDDDAARKGFTAAYAEIVKEDKHFSDEESAAVRPETQAALGAMMYVVDTLERWRTVVQKMRHRDAKQGSPED